jgi:polyhydroxybutyrate depolymerase
MQRYGSHNLLVASVAALVTLSCGEETPSREDDLGSAERPQARDGGEPRVDGGNRNGGARDAGGRDGGARDGNGADGATRPAKEPDGSSPAADAGARDGDARVNPPGEPSRSDGGPPSSPDAGGGEPSPASCAGKTAWKAGDSNGSIMVGGTKRTYILHVPASYKGDKPVPLLLDFHPMIFGTAASQRRSSGYAELADQEGFIVAYADGVDNAWNLGPCCTRSRDVDDFGLALAMVEKFKSEGCIDGKRVYAAGFSNGGGLSHYLACKSADVFAATSPAAFDLIQEVECKPSRPISVVIFRGTSDAIVPYAGGASTPPTPYPLEPIHFLGAQGTFKKWAEVDGCTGEPTSGAGGCKTYTQCKDGVEVTLCTAQGGSHATGDAKVAWPMLKKYTLP